MKDNLRRLTHALKVFGDVFYVNSVRKSTVEMQGKFNTKVIQKARMLKFKESISSTGYVELKRGVYEITLTD